jgi:hypothetical protein
METAAGACSTFASLLEAAGLRGLLVGAEGRGGVVTHALNPDLDVTR